MDFYRKLSQIGKLDMLYYDSNFVFPNFIKEKEVLDAFEDIIKNNRKTLIYRDYDMDGAMAGECIKETFNLLGYENYEVYEYSSRTHKVDPSAVTKAIVEHFDYIIILDAGSGEPDVMFRLMNMGVKVILLDHHQSIYGYEDFSGVKMINTSFDNRTRDDQINISAGALTYLVCEKLITRFGKKPYKPLAALALVSLYADAIDMSSSLCRSIYYKAMELDESQLPRIIQRFMNNYSSFTRRFIEYHMSPKINSLFRSESFDLLNRLLGWNPRSGIGIASLMESVNSVYEKYRAEVYKASDLIEVKLMDNFVIGNLSSVAEYVDIPTEKLHNYTGLVANQLASKYQRTAVVWADSGVDIKGSLRDLHGRNYLDLFRQFSKAEGHNSAFGIRIPYRDLEEFIRYVDLIDKQFTTKIENEPIIISHNYKEPDTSLMADIAKYNEFSGISTPIALVSKMWLDRVNARFTGYYYKVRWGKLYIKSRNRIRIGSELILKPYRGWDVELEVIEIGG